MALNKAKREHDLVGIDSSELRRRWTIELTSLRRRPNPTTWQQNRIRDLQSFMAAIDPLRKYEFDWRSMPGFDVRFASEIDAQRHINRNPAYQKDLKGKILAAMAGKALPEPSHPCRGIKQAQEVCEDHGEDWDAMLRSLLVDRLLRKEMDGSYAMSVPGCNLLEKLAREQLKPKGVQNAQSLMFAHLKGDVRDALAELKANLSQKTGGGAPRIMPDIKRSSTKINKPAAPLKNTTKASALLDKRSIVLKKLKSMSHPLAALHSLEQIKLLTVTEGEMRLVEKEPFAIWQYTFSIREIGNQSFSATGKSQREARAKAAAIAVEALKNLYSGVAA